MHDASGVYFQTLLSSITFRSLLKRARHAVQGYSICSTGFGLDAYYAVHRFWVDVAVALAQPCWQNEAVYKPWRLGD